MVISDPPFLGGVRNDLFDPPFGGGRKVHFFATPRCRVRKKRGGVQTPPFCTQFCASSYYCTTLSYSAVFWRGCVTFFGKKSTLPRWRLLGKRQSNVGVSGLPPPGGGSGPPGPPKPPPGGGVGGQKPPRFIYFI